MIWPHVYYYLCHGASRPLPANGKLKNFPHTQTKFSTSETLTICVWGSGAGATPKNVCVFPFCLASQSKT